MKKKDKDGTWLFEVSWEVCNKVGGIHEVVASKALSAVEKFDDRYFLLGPDLHNNAHFIESDDAHWTPLRNALSAREISCRFGHWDIPGNPNVILVSFANHHNSDQLLHHLWETYGVDSLSGGWDYIEPVLFSYTCGEVIATIYQMAVKPSGGRALAHVHEWMCGAGILALKTLAPAVATVFTTHATMLGRAMAGTNVDIYSKLKSIAPAREAAAYNISAKYSMESASAREADVFTTVSDITCEEAYYLLGRRADVVTTNGLDMRVIPDYAADRTASEDKRKRLLASVQKLLRRKLPEDTRIILTSGRYEYRNKGIDLFIEALAKVQQNLKNTDKHVLALCLAMGGHSGVNAAAVSGNPEIMPDPDFPEQGFLTSHHVYDAKNDAILGACRRFGIANRADDNVQFVFVPAMLDGADGFLNMHYFDVLSACDLGVFPSWYEPWGYTPHECAAFGVPTVTTDYAGYGLWARSYATKTGAKEGITVLARNNREWPDIVSDLADKMMHYAVCSEKELNAERISVRAFSEHTSWDEFFEKYEETYSLALEKSASRCDKNFKKNRQESLSRVLSARSSAAPYLRPVTVVADLPKEICRLRELANNMWWCWHREAQRLFEEINPAVWKQSAHNPLLVIETADPKHLARLANNSSYVALYTRLIQEFDDYINAPLTEVGQKGAEEGVDAQHPIAYFSCEYGLHESLPLYSGGLGVLSGDHLKAASDTGMPLVAFGLLYKNGYFLQTINKDGMQIPVYPVNDFSQLPVSLIKDVQDLPLEISIPLPGRILYAQAWVCRVGRISLYLLDTDIPKNTPADRLITARLYEAERDTRLRQEMLLGIGGVKLARKLGLAPTVYHMNEGHSAFLIIERLRQQLRNGLSLQEAIEYVSATNVFTTHTPVDAGNERFSASLISHYFTVYANELGLKLDEFLEFGRNADSMPNVFDMTVLALRFSCKANAVSWLHGYVSRYMWKNTWYGLPSAEVPIGYVTNGIHTASYVGEAFASLLEGALGRNWTDLPADSPLWDQIANIPDTMFSEAKRYQKMMLLNLLREKIQTFAPYSALDKDSRHEMTALLSPETLIIGFARRFAPYKRATMLFSDIERLSRILNQSNRPVIIVFAGKAHPADKQGADMIKEVISHSMDPRFRGKIFFIENYDLSVSRHLARGCDVWLNTPRRPYEASGTSGMKVPVNGGINLSISDGWWVEGAMGNNGWTIGPVIHEGRLEDNQSDYADAESLYSLLEEKVIPMYFKKGEDGISHEWIAVSKRSLSTLVAEYSSCRMVKQYFKEIYIPVATHGISLSRNSLKGVKKLARWRQETGARFKEVSFAGIKIDGMQHDTLACYSPLKISVRLNAGTCTEKDLLVQFVIGKAENNDYINAPTIVPLTFTKSEDGSLCYEAEHAISHNGQYMYGIRVMPVCEELANPLTTGFLLWG